MSPLRLAVCLLLLVAQQATAAPTDHSFRIATFNTYMLGEGSSVPNEMCSIVMTASDACQFVDPEAPILECVCGRHPRYDAAARQAGASDLADRIRKSGLDVIVLNEVWDPEVRDILHYALEDIYKYQVTYVGTSTAPAFDQISDSGLMLFSKFPFEPINANYAANTTCSVGGYATDEFIEAHIYADSSFMYSDASVKTHFAFERYMRKTGDDERAQKGVAYVRVKNPESGRIMNIFFTHTQGSYAPEWSESSTLDGVASVQMRAFQLQDFKELYEAGLDSLHPGPNSIIPTTQDVFYLGDLNIDGDRSNTVNNMAAGTFNNLGEWSKYFDSAATLGGLLSTQLWDTWMYEHPLRNTIVVPTVDDDFGITSDHVDCAEDKDPNGGPVGSSSAKGCRWDILAHNTQIVSRPLCNQHPSIAHNLNAAGPDEIGMSPGGRGNWADGMGGLAASDKFHSDHLGLQSDYNQAAPQCSPLFPQTAALVYGDSAYGARFLTAADVGNVGSQPDPNNPGNYLSGTIAHPGSVQWFYIPPTMKGSYIIGFKNTGDPTLEAQGFVAQVFAPGDFSRAVKNYKDEDFTVGIRNGTGGLEPMKGKKFVFDNPPYYIKVFNKNHGTTGAYSLGVHRCNCTNKDADACVILPSSPVASAESYQFPATTLQSWPTPESMYFVFDVQQLTTASTQKIQTVVAGYTQDSLETMITTAAKSIDVPAAEGTDQKVNAGYTSRVAAGDVAVGSTGFNTSCGAGTGTLGESDVTGCNNAITWQHPQPTDPVATHYLRVRRKQAGYTGAFKALWRTEMSVLRGDAATSLRCDIETHDVSERDEISLSFAIDGAASPYLWVSHFNAGEIQPLGATVQTWWGPTGIKVKSSLSTTLRELDDGDDELSPAMQATLKSFTTKGPHSAYAEQNNSVFGAMFDSGAYTFFYALSHGSQPYETFIPPSATLLSQGKTAFQSSTWNGWTASRANDGGASYAAAGNSVSSTSSQLNPWWYTWLGGTKTVESVHIYACTAGCAAGAFSNLYVDYWNGSAWVNKAFVSTVSIPYTVVDMTGVTASYVRVRKQNETNHLQLAEVKVFGF